PIVELAVADGAGDQELSESVKRPTLRLTDETGDSEPDAVVTGTVGALPVVAVYHGGVVVACREAHRRDVGQRAVRVVVGVLRRAKRYVWRLPVPAPRMDAAGCAATAQVYGATPVQHLQRRTTAGR